MSNMRFRFSPAPTGDMHIGNMRTALFNWLQARHSGATFILRIEDTDVARSTQASIEQIQLVLRWTGLDWDEGPVLQSTHFDRYLAEAQRLVDAGQAYECFCTEAEVRERNEQAMKEGRTPGYDGRCRDLTADKKAAFVAEGRVRSVRFRTPDEGRSTFVDIVRGEVSVEWSTIADFVIVRSNGTPVFFLANAVDDADMGITHVLRGDDLLDSTHRVLALRQALGYGDPPVYAHTPMILGPGGGKLSKRHAAVSVEDYRDAGYLAHALVNYLALLGWGPEDGREVLTIDELIAEFDVGRVNPSSATFDPKKLEWMNGEHIRKMTLSDLVSATLPFAQDRYREQLDVPKFERAVALAQQRATTLVQIAEQAAFLFVPDEEFVIDENSWEKVLTTERAKDVLDAVIAYVEHCEWSDEVDVRPAIVDIGLKPNKKIMPVLYSAIEGTGSGLPLFDSIALLGRDRALHRLRAGASEARQRVKRLLKLAIRVIVVLVGLVVLYVAVTFVQVWMASRRDDARPSQAIVVLGAAQYNGRPSPVLAARLDHAIDLYRARIAPVIVVTGGRQPGDQYTEAGASADYLHEHGIDERAILRETTGRTSWESLEAAARFLTSRDMVRVVLVSDPYHSKRISAIAHDVGLDAVTSPTRTSPIKGFSALKRMWGETLRVAAGRVFGYARLDRHREITKLVPGFAKL